MAGKQGRAQHGAEYDPSALVALDDTTPDFNPGRPPLVTDEELQMHYDEQEDPFDPRPSFSQPRTGAPLPGGPGAAHNAPPRPYFVDQQARTYSQTSGLNNYQEYGDEELDDVHSMRGTYGNGGVYNDEVDSTPQHQRTASRQARDRNSVLSMGGGFMGKVKSKLGMGEGYTGMEMPLTDADPHRTATMDSDGVPQKPSLASRVSNFKFGIRKRKPNPASLGPRIIHLNNAPTNSQRKFRDNHISTTKYNVVTFLPKFLYEQFSKYANLFFLFTAILQQIPDISPTNRYTTIGPLIIVLLVSAGKELIEDWKRRKSDTELNRSRTQVLKGDGFQSARWIDVKVGDIVRVDSEEPFPADLVLIASSEPEGLCYIETANLDGETNLKIKQAIPETADLVSPQDLGRLTGRLRSEQPNSSLYTYEATLATAAMGKGEKELPLAPDQLLLRGATLRNTPWIHGIVVFTGHETKLMRNATATPIKRTAVERMLNQQILMLVCILLTLSIISSGRRFCLQSHEEFTAGIPLQQQCQRCQAVLLRHSDLLGVVFELGADLSLRYRRDC